MEELVGHASPLDHEVEEVDAARRRRGWGEPARRRVAVHADSIAHRKLLEDLLEGFARHLHLDGDLLAARYRCRRPDNSPDRLVERVDVPAQRQGHCRDLVAPRCQPGPAGLVVGVPGHELSQAQHLQTMYRKGR